MKKLISSKWLQYVIPFVIWLLFILPFITSGDNNFPEEERRKFMLEIISSNFLLLGLFYIHTYALYPLINKKVGWYLLALLVLLIGYWFLRDTIWHALHQQPQGERPHMPNPQHEPYDRHGGGPKFGRGGGPPFGGGGFGGAWPFFGRMFSAFVVLLCSFCYRLVLDNRARKQALKEKETIHLKSELTFLRSQISPHFIFNVLNNLVSLARKKSDDLEPAIVNLSQFMRYMLYESDDNRVFLSKEVEYLQSYINLQKLRFGANVKVTLDIDGNADIYTIEPMLLIPFVENAFKHGTGMVDDPVITITLSIDDTTRLMKFKVVNTVSTLDVSKDNDSGIGISNVQRRLAILYPGKHELHIANEGDIFIAELNIYLAN